MKTCHFCKEEISEKEQICPYCGYNFQTDTLTPDFVRKAKKKDKANKRKLVGSGVRTFVFWAGLIIIASLIFKYHGKIGDLIWQAKSFFKKDKKNEINKSVGLLDVGSIKIPAGKLNSKEKKIEGIFYDPTDKNYVVIGGQLIPEGQSYGNLLIRKINQDSVEVVEDGNIKIFKVDTNIGK